MRILVHDYAGHAFPAELSRELASRGHDVLHACASSLQTPRGDLVRSEQDSENFLAVQVEMDRRYSELKYSFIQRRKLETEYRKRAASLVAEWRPEFVLSGNTPTEVQSGLLEATKAIEGKFLYWLQDIYSVAVERLARKRLPLIGPLVGMYYRRLDRQQFFLSDVIVAITEDFRPILAEEYGASTSKISVVPNWAPIEKLPVLPKRNQWSKKHGIADKFCFLYTGTLGMKHNPDLLLQLALHYREDDAVRIVVISEGIGADWLRQERRKHRLNNLLLLPYQPFTSLPEVIASGDVLIGILEEEASGFCVPSKVLTYLCASRPILLAVPQSNLAARIVDENAAGIVTPPSHRRRFVEAAVKLHLDRELAAAAAVNGRDYAENTFSIKTIGDRFENILARLDA